jgi:hypothetical protein
VDWMHSAGRRPLLIFSSDRNRPGICIAIGIPAIWGGACIARRPRSPPTVIPAPNLRRYQTLQKHRHLMTNKPNQFASSSNGDAWLLSTTDDTGVEVVIHRVNKPSGGHETRRAIPEFLDLRPLGPEHDALVELLRERMASKSSADSSARSTYGR